MGLFKSGQSGSRRCVLVEGAGGIAVSVFDQKQRIKSEFLRFSAGVFSSREFSNFVELHQLKNMLCQYIFQPHDYQLTYIDAPPVLDAERRQAIRWLVKGLVDVEHTAVDYFPVSVRPGVSSKLYVVTLPLEAVQSTVARFMRCSLRVEQMTIAEFPLSVLAPRTMDPFALVYQDEKIRRLLIVKGGELALIRELGTVDNFAFDKIRAECVRSFDFYQSQCGGELPEVLYALPSLSSDALLLEQLQESIACRLEWLNFPEMTLKLSPNEAQLVYLSQGLLPDEHWRSNV